MVRDIHGSFVEPSNLWGKAYAWCPSNPALREYYSALFADLAARYEIDGITLTHLRFSPLGHSFNNLFSCACAHCQRAAKELGYDFDKMKGGLDRLVSNLKALRVEKLKLLSETGLSPIDLLYYLAPDAEILNWLDFRCALIQRSMSEIYKSVKSARKDILFGSDQFPPSFAVIAGHNYPRMEEYSDFMNPLLPHVYVFVILSLLETATRLVEWNKMLDKDVALKLAYQLFGYDGLEMPNRMELLLGASRKLDETQIPSSRIVKKEATKAASMARGTVPMYGSVAAHSQITPESAAANVQAIKDAGMKGVILVLGTLPGSKENVEAVASVLHSKS